MTKFLKIFRRYPTSFRRFPKMFLNFSEVKANVSEHFSDIFRRLPKISETAPIMLRSYSNIAKYVLKDYVTIAIVIMLVTMATSISTHVKDKNSTFTACDEDMIFLVKGEILVFHRCLCNK